jgi:uncharacterized protein with PQ loop repeat
MLGIIAAFWTMAMAVSLLLQAREIWRRRSSAEISITYLWVLVVGSGLWLAYGVASRDVPLLVPNSVAQLVMAATIAIAMRHRG